MPIIKKPKEQAVPAKGFIDPNAGPRAAASGAAIGKMAMSAGQADMSRGLSTLQKAGNALANLNNTVRIADYTNRISQGNQRLNNAVNNRLRQPLDDDGNPTFDNLTTDVEKLGREIKTDISSTIKDPAVKAKFEDTFNREIENKQLLSLSQARTQKLDYIKSSLNTGVESLVSQGVDDDLGNINFYRGEINTVIDSAAASGALAPDHATELKTTAIDNLMLGQTDKLINANPEQAVQQLEQLTAEGLGVPEKTFKKMVNKAEAAADDARTNAQLKRAEDVNIKTETTNLMATQLEAGIETNELGKKHIVEALQTGAITEDQFVDLVRKRENITKTKAKELATDLGISSSLQKGLPPLDFTTGEVSKHYQKRVALTSKDNQAPTLSQKATLALQYKTRVKPFQNELESTILHSNDEAKISEAFRVYDKVTNESREVISGMDKENEATITIAKRFFESTSLSAVDSMERAKDIMNVNKDKKAELNKEFKKIPEFNEDLEDTIKTLHISSTRELILGVPSKIVDEDTTAAFRSLFRDNYTLTGNADDAIELTKAQTKAIFGESQFNEEPGLLNDKERLMLYPPEKVFRGFTFDELNQDFTESISNSLPEGVTTEQTKIKSDSLTASTGLPVSYAVTYTNKFGEEILLTDEFDRPLRWVPEPQKIRFQNQEKALEEATIKRTTENRFRKEKIEELERRRKERDKPRGDRSRIEPVSREDIEADLRSKK